MEAAVRGLLARREKERGARRNHKRLLDYFNVNRTSLDHLLLGGCADIDTLSNAASITLCREQNGTNFARLFLLSPTNVTGDPGNQAFANAEGEIRLLFICLTRFRWHLACSLLLPNM